MIFSTLFKAALRESNLADDVRLVRVADIGIYNHGMVLKILPENMTYANVEPSDIKRIIGVTLKHGNPVKDLLYKPRVPPDAPGA